MTKLEQAARQALVALEDVMTDFDGSWALADTAITALREALAEQATVSGGLCGGCAKKAADGWALYCVECWEKSNDNLFANGGKMIAEQAEREPIKRFTSDDVKVAFENGYAAAMSVADVAKEVEQEPVFISNEQFRSMHFSKVTVYKQNDGKEVIVCTPIRTHIEGFWCEDLTCAKCYTAEFRLKHTAPVRTKDLTDKQIEKVWNKNGGYMGMPIDFARAVIAADREKNK